jgi:Cobalamin-independent synthase, N-terminal domain
MTTNSPLKTSSLGFPRMGKERKLKFALESFWKGTSSEAHLLAVASKLRRGTQRAESGVLRGYENTGPARLTPAEDGAKLIL